MKAVFFTSILIVVALVSKSQAFEGISVNLGLEYDPIAKLDYVDTNQPSIEIFDNISWEAGLFYNSRTGFRTGAFFDYYGKTVERTDTRNSKLTEWGIGMLGDYGYELTESGKTFLVGGMETGYGNLRDKNEFSSKRNGALWVAGIVGIRHYFSRSFSMEMDYRIKWLQYEFNSVPRKNYNFSGSTVRFTLGYGIYSEKSEGGGS